MSFSEPFNIQKSYFQTWNLSKILHRRIFSFSKKKHKKMSENGEIYSAGKNFTLPPALTALTNSTSVQEVLADLKKREVNSKNIDNIICIKPGRASLFQHNQSGIRSNSVMKYTH